MDFSIPSLFSGLALGLTVTYIVSYLTSWRRRRLRKEKVLRFIRSFKPCMHLEDHPEECENEILNVTPGVYVAIGYGLANSIMLEGDDGVIIVDTEESVEVGREVMAEFRQITNKPVKAIIYTHNHGDHCYGTEAFVEDKSNPPQIWAHKDFLRISRNFMLKTNGIAHRRAMRQFGCLLPTLTNSGIGGKLRYGPEYSIGLMEPTHLLEEDELDLEIAGVRLRLLHLPGETPDQLCVFLPESRVLIAADNIYRSFPNLYAIRGTPTRDFGLWVRSLDKMRRLSAESLVPCHTRPVFGREEIEEILTVYRDAIQFINDQTLRYMNQGFDVDDIVPLVRLPPQLEQHPFLQQFYGTVPWCVRAQFCNHVGWFSGDPVDLNPADPEQRAKCLIELAGGSSSILEAARSSLKKGAHQFALELCAALLRIEPSNQHAIKIKTDAMKALAERQVSANGRNYYLTCALEDLNLVDNLPLPGGRRWGLMHFTMTVHVSRLQALAERQVSANGRNYYLTCALEDLKLVDNLPLPGGRRWGLMHFTMTDIFETLAYRVKAEECFDRNEVYMFEFTDTKELFCLHLRNGILEVTKEEKENYKLKITTTTDVWRKLLLQDVSAPTEILKGTIVLDGSVADLLAFNGIFEHG